MKRKIKIKKRNQRVADKNEVRGSDPGTLQNRNLLVKMYGVRGSNPTGNTVISEVLILLITKLVPEALVPMSELGLPLC